jgi:hypothetical protein
MEAVRARLARATSELKNLDDEIAEINEQLSAPAEPPPVRRAPDQNCRLYIESISKCPMPHSPADDVSDEVVHHATVQIAGYRPPSQRLRESQERKARRVRELRAESEQKFCVECPFAPTLTDCKPVPDYDPGHLFQPRRIQPAEEVTEKPKVTVSNGIYERQCKPKPHRTDPPIPRRIIEADAEQEMVARLTKPRPSFEAPTECPTGGVAHRKTIDQLVSESIRKSQTPQDAPQQPQRHMTKMSQKLTKGVKRDLFDECFEARMRKNEAASRWQQYQQNAVEVTRPPEKAPRIDISRPCEVIGVESHLDRMKRAAAPRKPEKEVETPAVIIVRPFSFEAREAEKNGVHGPGPDTIMMEISDILRQSSP